MSVDIIDAEDASATSEPTVTFATARGLATRIVALQQRGRLTEAERHEFVDAATTLASLIANDRAKVEIHIGLVDGIPCGGRADAPVSIVIKDYDDPPTDPVALGYLVLDSAGTLAWPYRLATGNGIVLRRDPGAFLLRCAEDLLTDPDAWRGHDWHNPSPPRSTPDGDRERVVAVLRAHEAMSVANEVEQAADAATIVRIAHAAYDVDAITETHAVLLALLAVLIQWDGPEGCGFRDVLGLLLDRLDCRRPPIRPRFALAPDAVLDIVVKELGAPKLNIPDGALAAGHELASYIEAADRAGAIVAPAGHRVVVEGTIERTTGSRLRLAVERRPGKPQLSWGWRDIEELPDAERDASPRRELGRLLTAVVNELNSLLART